MKFTKEYMDFGGSVYFFSDVDKLPDTKENALLRYLSMTCKSWTFGRMTKQERERCIKSFLDSNNRGFIKGDFHARWNTMHAIYAAFLSALGYEDNPGDWRGAIR